MMWTEVIVCFICGGIYCAIYMISIEEFAFVKLLSAFRALVCSDKSSTRRVAATHLTAGFERGCADSYAADRRNRKSFVSEPVFLALVRQHGHQASAIELIIEY
jgi:hypothetical protein